MRESTLSFVWHWLLKLITYVPHQDTILSIC